MLVCGYNIKDHPTEKGRRRKGTFNAETGSLPDSTRASDHAEEVAPCECGLWEGRPALSGFGLVGSGSLERGGVGGNGRGGLCDGWSVLVGRG